MKKINKEKPPKEIPAPPKSVAPLFSNIVMVNAHTELVLLDFGFLAPPYIENADYMEDSQVARICLSWGTAEILHHLLSEALEARSRTKNKKRSRTPRSK